MKRLPVFYAAFFTDAVLRRMITYAVVLYGAEVLGGGQWAGLLYLCLVLPYLLSLHAGSVIDHSARRRVLQITAASTLALMLVLAGAEQCGTPHGLVIAAVILVYGIVSAFAYPAFVAAVADVAERERIGHSTVVVNILAMLSHVCAPVAVGLLRMNLAWPALFGVFAALAAASWLALAGARLPRTTPPADTTTVRERLRELYVFCREHPSLPSLLLAIAAFSGLVVGPLEVLTPLFAENPLGLPPLRAGAFLAAGGLGLVAGAFGALKLVGRVNLGAWLCGCGVAGGLLIIVMTFAGTNAAFGLFFTAGALGGVFSSLAIAGTQARASDALRGRVMGLFTLILGAPPAIGGALAGAMSDTFGTVTTIRVFFTTVAVVFAVFFVTLKSLRPRTTSVADAGTPRPA